MALYENNPKVHIPYLNIVKTFGELKDRDEVYILHIDSLDIETVKVNNVQFENWSDNDWYYIGGEPRTLEYNFDRVNFHIDELDRDFYVMYHTESNLIERSDRNSTLQDIVICTTKREAEQIKKILLMKCDIQMNQFKNIFNGQGWNYATPEVVYG